MPVEPRLIRTTRFYSIKPFLSMERFITHLTIKRCVEMNRTPHVVLLYLGDPIILPHRSSIKLLQQLAYNSLTGAQKQYIFDHKQSFLPSYTLMERENRALKRKLHNEFFKFHEITEMRFVKQLCFPKF